MAVLCLEVLLEFLVGGHAEVNGHEDGENPEGVGEQEEEDTVNGEDDKRADQ